MGLLSPSRATKGGHRLYTADEVVRVQQIKEYLDDPNFSKQRLLRLYRSWLREQIKPGEELRNKLETIETQLRSGQKVPAEEFMRAMSMLEKPLTLEEREGMKTKGPGLDLRHDR